MDYNISVNIVIISDNIDNIFQFNIDLNKYTFLKQLKLILINR